MIKVVCVKEHPYLEVDKIYSVWSANGRGWLVPNHYRGHVHPGEMSGFVCDLEYLMIWSQWNRDRLIDDLLKDENPMKKEEK